MHSHYIKENQRRGLFKEYLKGTHEDGLWHNRKPQMLSCVRTWVQVLNPHLQGEASQAVEQALCASLPLFLSLAPLTQFLPVSIRI